MTKASKTPWADVPELRREIMRANRRKDTGPELALRSALHRRGLRYRVDHPIRVTSGRPLRPDVVFTRARVAVYLHGCYWHGCPVHGTTPATRREYWTAKIADNKARDARHARLLEEAGWTVVQVWEHEDPKVAASTIARVIAGALGDDAGT
jgi:DNA mismatch endonuclease (patch repair protein)